MDQILKSVGAVKVPTDLLLLDNKYYENFMTSINNILIPIDFTEKSAVAIPFAIDILSKSNGKLSLLNSIDIPRDMIDDLEDEDLSSHSSLVSKARDNSLSKLKSIIIKNNLNQFRHRCYIREGNVDREILRVIKKSDIHLVIMGTNAGHEDYGFFGGSITSKMMQHSKCPVLAIPKSVKFRNISTIVYATNSKSNENSILSYIIRFAEFYDAEIILLHIDQTHEIIESNSQNLEKLVSLSQYPKINIKEIVSENLESGIYDYVTKNKFDLLAMTTHTTSLFNKLFHQSLTKKMLFKTQVPMLIFNKKFHNNFK